jgi:hypothetical protein
MRDMGVPTFVPRLSHVRPMSVPSVSRVCPTHPVPALELPTLPFSFYPTQIVTREENRGEASH